MFYEAMFKRKSVRKYTEEPLDKGVLESIEAYINNIESLYPDIKTEFKILPKDKVSSVIKAPQYVAVFSEEKEGYLTNVGFMLEQLDLFLSDSNIGACWIGIGNPEKEIKEKSELKFVILLAFGTGAEPIHRKGISEFKRKPVEQISNIDNPLMEIVRLAPSGMNSQAWYFNQKGSEIDIYITKGNPIKNALFGKGRKIDIGIAMCFLWSVAKHNDSRVQFISHKDRELKGYEYIATANIIEKQQII